MKKVNVSGYSFHRLGDNYKSRNEVEILEADSKVSSTDNILNLIYAPDPRTNLPSGDLNYWVSDKVSPDVKEFIKNNLMMDVSSAKNVSADPSLSDDDILALTRNAGESIEEYAARLNSSIDKDKWFIQQAHVSSRSEESSVSVK